MADEPTNRPILCLDFDWCYPLLFERMAKRPRTIPDPPVVGAIQIVAYIDSLEARAETRTVMTRTQVLENLSSEALDMSSWECSHRERIRALELLGKHHKLFIERVPSTERPANSTT